MKSAMQHSLLALPLAAGLALASGACMAQAEAWPSRPVSIAIPFTPGNSLDTEVRIYAQHLGETFKRPFVVDYKPGAATTIGTVYVARSAPDGHTLLATTASMTVVPGLYKEPPYDPIKDFAPVTIMSKAPALLTIYPGLPVKSIPEFINYLRSKPGEINVATSGSGTIYHIATAWLHSLTNTKVTFVHYKGGNEVYLALMSGEVQAAMNPPLSTMPLVKAGKMRIIGASERTRMLPDVPSIEEQGVQGYGWAQWTGVLAPARTPAAVVNRLGAEFGRIAKIPDVVQKLEVGKEVVGSTPEEFRKLIAAEVPRWRKVVQDNGIKADN